MGQKLIPFRAMRCSILSLLLFVAIAIGLEDGSMQNEKDLAEFRAGDRGQKDPKTKPNQATPNGSNQAASESAYTLVPKTSCKDRYTDGTKKIIPTLEKAKEACSSDGKCTGVWDCKCIAKECNIKGFKLCKVVERDPKKGFLEMYSSACTTYQKTTKTECNSGSKACTQRNDQNEQQPKNKGETVRCDKPEEGEPTDTFGDNKKEVYHYCPEKGYKGKDKPKSGNYALIQYTDNASRDEIHIEWAVGGKCQRAGTGSVGKECFCSGLLGSLLKKYSKPTTKAITLTFAVDDPDNFSAGCGCYLGRAWESKYKYAKVSGCIDDPILIGKNYKEETCPEIEKKCNGIRNQKTNSRRYNVPWTITKEK